jgi:DNA polymerase-3 subunit gamma/tau
MAVLYRKYRPQTFSEVLNQKYIIQTLKNQIISGSVAHAYLFTGSRGVGKTSVARILAKGLNCKQLSENNQSHSGTPNGDACGVCEICKQVEANNFIDLVEIDAASNTGVDNIRELIEHVKFAPSVGKYKVFIIDEVHMLSKGAFNALLKTLEEPPKHAVFVLATTEINKVPVTIISRTQRFDFKALSAEDLFNHLKKISAEEKINLSDEVLSLVAEAGDGSVRDSLSLLGKILSLGDSPGIAEVRQLLGVTDIAVCENLLELMSLGKAAQLPDFFATLAENAPDFKILNRDFLEFLRKILIYKLTEDAGTGLVEHQEKIKNLGQNLSVQDAMFFIRLFLRSYKEMESSPNAQISLLLAAVEGALKKTTVKAQSFAANPEPSVLKNPPIVKEDTNNQDQRNLLKEEPQIINESLQSSGVELINQDEVIDLTFEEVATLLPKAISKLKQINGPLSSIMRGAKILEPKRGKIVLGVKFLFDKQNLENAKNLNLIHEILKEVFEKSVGLITEVIKPDSVSLGDKTASLTEALQVFGGELVE